MQKKNKTLFYHWQYSRGKKLYNPNICIEYTNGIYLRDTNNWYLYLSEYYPDYLMADVMYFKNSEEYFIGFTSEEDLDKISVKENLIAHNCFLMHDERGIGIGTYLPIEMSLDENWVILND